MPETVGVDFLLKSNSTVIGGKEDATLNKEAASSELAPTQGTGTQFARSLTGLKDWSIDFDSLWLLSSNAESGFAPTVQVNPSASPAGPTLNRITDVTLTLERNLIEFANSSNSEYIARGAGVMRMTAEITVDIDATNFYATDTASKLLIDAWNSTGGEEDVRIELPSTSTNFEATWIVSDISIDTPADDAAQATFSLESDGTITENINSNLDTGLDNLITPFFASNPSTVTALLTTDNSGDIEWSGEVLPSTLDINIPVDGAEEGVNVSGTVDGDGSLTIQETP